MDENSAPLFDVYLRLKPSESAAGVSSTAGFEPATAERYLAVEEPFLDNASGAPTHIVVSPPADSRRRAVEKFAFTRVFQEDASQLDIFKGVDVLSLVEGVLAPPGTKQRDGLVATLGVTGSGKVGRSTFPVCVESCANRLNAHRAIRSWDLHHSAV